MKPTYAYTIPTPCSEAWHTMSPTEQGRFCMNCQKQVIDFSSMTDEQIVSIIEGAQGSVCGSFRSTQLNRPMVLSYNIRRPSSLKAIIAGIVLLTILNTSTEASVAPSTSVTQSVFSINKQGQQIELADTGTYVYKGRLLNADDSSAVAYASVYLSDQIVTSDSLGRFELTIPDSLLEKQIVIKVYTPGTLTVGIEVNLEGLKYEQEYVSYVQLYIRTVGIIVPVEYNKRKWRRMERKLDKE